MAQMWSYRHIFPPSLEIRIHVHVHVYTYTFIQSGSHTLKDMVPLITITIACFSSSATTQKGALNNFTRNETEKQSKEYQISSKHYTVLYTEPYNFINIRTMAIRLYLNIILLV